MPRKLPDDHHREIKLDRLRTVLDLVQLETVEAVAQQSNLQTTSITNQIREISKAMGGEQLFVQGAAGHMTPTEFLTDQLDTIAAIDSLWAKLSRARSHACAIAFLPQHASFVADATAVLRSKVKTTLHPLGEHDRSEAGFARTVDKVASGQLDLAIGLGSQKRHSKKKTGGPVEGAAGTHRYDRADVVSKVLYQSELVAMVPVEEGLAELDLSDLIKRELLLAPSDTRSRQRLNEALALAELPELTGEMVKLEAYGTKVLVAFGSHKHGTVVVPSDIAYPFRAGNQLAGEWAEKFTWARVTSGGKPITNNVYVTTRGDTTADVEAVAAELSKAVKRQKKLDTRPESAAESTAG